MQANILERIHLINLPPYSSQQQEPHRTCLGRRQEIHQQPTARAHSRNTRKRIRDLSSGKATNSHTASQK